MPNMLTPQDRAELITLRRHFHRHPERSLEERETADYVEQYLRSIGLSPVRVGELGVVATVFAPGGELCRTAAIRAEMDALAVEEKTDLPWRSQTPGTMHACGHDAILATALVLARLCVRNREQLSVNVKFLFQPAEENGKGTAILLDEGVMETPAVDYFMMFHYVNDAPSGVELHRGSSSAMIGPIELTIHGRSSHWCTKELGIDSIAAAGRLIGILEEINSTYEAKAPFVLGIGKIEGGTAKNVVAEETRLEGTVRACRKEDYLRLQKILHEKIAALSRELGVRIEGLVGDAPIPPIVNDDAMVDLGLEIGEKVWGKDCRLMTREYLSGDSASYYFDHARGIFVVFTAQKPGEENYPLHNGKFDLDEAVMEKAAEFLFQYILGLPIP